MPHVEDVLQTKPEAAAATLSAASAHQVATEYLIDNLGELLSPGTPLLDGDKWVIPINLSTVFTGLLGQVGTISVDANTGAVAFSDEDRAKVKASAQALVGTYSP